jgi:hypothetical protein
VPMSRGQWVPMSVAGVLSIVVLGVSVDICICHLFVAGSPRGLAQCAHVKRALHGGYYWQGLQLL